MVSGGKDLPQLGDEFHEQDKQNRLARRLFWTCIALLGVVVMQIIHLLGGAIW